MTGRGPATDRQSSPAAAEGTPDRLPVSRHDVVPTPGLLLASSLAQVALDVGGLLVLDGPSGTGKTTGAAWIARQHPEWTWAYLQVPSRVRGEEVPAHVQEAITGYPARGRVRDIQRESVRLLGERRIAFIADEVQHAGPVGLQALRYLGDLTDMGPAGAAPIFYIGHGSLAAVSRVPELLDRLVGDATFGLLAGGELLGFVHTLHPRLAVTSDEIVMRLDDQCAGNGSLRSWHTIVELLVRLGRHEPPTRPVTTTEVGQIAMFRKNIASIRRPLPGRDT